jgi:NAD(P)-dependent dehydrogenase (short-subunit alcohol dehydrogenase family)
MVERAFTSDVRKQLVDSVPMRAFGRPEDVAQAALYLASEESRYVTGTRLVVDGGVTMQ